MLNQEADTIPRNEGPAPAPTSRLGAHLHLDVCDFVAATHSLSVRTMLLGKSRLVFLESGGELKMKARLGQASCVMWVSLKGSARFQLDKEVIACGIGGGCIWPASTDIRVSASNDHAALAICIDRPVLELELSRLLGRPAHGLWFSPWLKIDTPSSIFGALLKFIGDAIDRNSGELSDSPILSAATERLLVDALLMTQPNNYSDSLRAINTAAVPRHLRAVMRAIRRDSARSWRLSDMAVEGSVSVRTVCDSFRRFCACTPKQFVQRVRLAHVREMLTTSESPSTSIAEIARECGFRHPGRFASTYQQVYGETPSETMRTTLNASRRSFAGSSDRVPRIDASIGPVRVTTNLMAAPSEATRRFK
jgi:AraC-like DNA-binding protein